MECLPSNSIDQTAGKIQSCDFKTKHWWDSADIVTLNWWGNSYWLNLNQSLIYKSKSACTDTAVYFYINDYISVINLILAQVLWHL